MSDLPSAWLLVRRSGALWGVPRDALTELPGGQPARVVLRGDVELRVDEILTLARSLTGRPMPPAAAPYLGKGIQGLALWQGEPVILLAAGGTTPICLTMETETREMQAHGE